MDGTVRVGSGLVLGVDGLALVLDVGDVAVVVVGGVGDSLEAAVGEVHLRRTKQILFSRRVYFRFVLRLQNPTICQFLGKEIFASSKHQENQENAFCLVLIEWPSANTEQKAFSWCLENLENAFCLAFGEWPSDFAQGCC